MNIAFKGALVATAAAGLFACSSGGGTGGPASQAASGTEMVKCSGINECKGQGACGGQGHDCAGKNECKGQGWLETTAAECEAQGGEVI